MLLSLIVISEALAMNETVASSKDTPDSETVLSEVKLVTPVNTAGPTRLITGPLRWISRSWTCFVNVTVRPAVTQAVSSSSTAVSMITQSDRHALCPPHTPQSSSTALDIGLPSHPRHDSSVKSQLPHGPMSPS